MRNKIYLLLLAIFLIATVNSASPFITQSGNTLSIEHPYQETIKAGEDYYFHFHVYNVSNNYKSVNMSATTCSFHLYGEINNTNGRHIFKNNFKVGSDDILDYEQIIKGGNFTNGAYGFVFECNSSNERGVYENTFKATPTGTELTVPQAILFFFILALLTAFLYISVSGVRNSISGSWLIAYTSISYVLIYSIIGLAYLLSNFYLWSTPIFEKILYIIWFIMGIGLLPFIIILTLYIMGQEAKATLQKNFMSQGYSKDEARNMSNRRR